MGTLSGRVALVAGASRGIGMGAAVELAAAGATVYAMGRTLDPGRITASGSLVETAHLAGTLGGRAVPTPCDCTSPAEVTAVIDRVRDKHGRLDILVNSVFSAPDFGASIGKRFWELPVDLWDATVTLGARSAYLTSALAAPLMIESATAARPGLIVNVSGRGAVAHRYNVAYGVGKAATDRLTRDCALELTGFPVAVVSLWPNGYAIGNQRRETPRYAGRGVASLAGDPDLLDRTGQAFWTADLGCHYDFRDENGHTHGVGPLVDELSLEHLGSE